MSATFFRSLVFLCASALLFACDFETDEPSPGASARVEDEVPSAPEAEAPPIETRRPEVVTPPAESEEAAATPVERQALEAAADAADNAPRGRDACESAINAIVAMLDATESVSGMRAARPERADFLTVCRTFPSAAQRCLVPSHAMANQEECARTLQALPRDKLDALEAAMQIAPNE